MFFEILLSISGVIINTVVFCIMFCDDKLKELEYEIDRHGGISFLKIITVIIFLPAYLCNFLQYWLFKKICAFVKILSKNQLSAATLVKFRPRMPRLRMPRMPFGR